MVPIFALGPRLSCIASYVPMKAKLGDIGTDHAYLPVALCEQGIISSAVAVDVHKGPYLSALMTVQSYGLEGRISVRLGDGLEPVTPKEVDTLTFAGMGGNTMLDILAAKPEVLDHVSEMILQPQGAETKVRVELLEKGWLLKAEQLVEEDERIYAVMVFSKNAGHRLAELRADEDEWRAWAIDLESKALDIENKSIEHLAKVQDHVTSLFWQFGPLLLKKPDFLLKHLYKERIEELNYRLVQMQKGKNPSVHERIKETETEKRWVENMAKRLF